MHCTKRQAAVLLAGTADAAGLVLAGRVAWRAALSRQLQRAPGTPDRVLVMVGGNDVIRLSPWDRLRADLLASVREAQNRGAKVVLMPCGDVGQAPFFPPPWRWWLQHRSDTLHQVVDATGRATGAAVVDLRLPAAADPFLQQPQRYDAADGLHPNGAGYRLWFERLQQAQVLG